MKNEDILSFPVEEVYPVIYSIAIINVSYGPISVVKVGTFWLIEVVQEKEGRILKNLNVTGSTLLACLAHSSHHNNCKVMT